MRKKIVIVAGTAIAMSGLWGMFVFLLDTWGERSTFYKMVGLMALAGWIHITYNMMTLKYKWIRKLAE